MAVYHFSVTDANCRDSTLIGMSIDVQTTAYYPGFKVDVDGLFHWSLMIAGDVVHQRVDHNELIDEGIHIRVISESGKTLVDTIVIRQAPKAQRNASTA